MERISVIKGQHVPEKMPLILIAPHGPDDQGTAFITEEICNLIGCDGIINNGFERSDKFDYAKEKCDCNNIIHCVQDVVKEEFLDPIDKAVNRMYKNSVQANIFIIHGMSDQKEPVDMVIGYGDSTAKHPPYSCEMWQKNAWMYILKSAGISGVYAGKAGGKYAGASKNNLNQYFTNQASMQIEITRALRVGTKADQWLKTANFLTTCFSRYINFVLSAGIGSPKIQLPPNWSPDWESIAEKLPSF